MSLTFNITRYALLALVAVSLGAWSVRTWTSVRTAAAGEVLPPDAIVVVNFHGANRCSACREIGTEAQAVVEQDFAADVKSGRMNWRVINFEAPGNQHFVQDYKLTASTIVVTRREGGRDIEWQRLDAVWDHLFEGPAMRAYLNEHIAQVAGKTNQP